MKRFITNQTLTFRDEQLIKGAIEIIANEAIIHNNTDKSTFVIYKNINILFKKNYAEIETNFKVMFQIDDAYKLLNFLLVKTNNVKGISHLRYRGIYFSDLSFQDQEHIRRLCKYPFFGASPESIYDKFVYGTMTPKELNDEYDVSANFIRALRNTNRKRIMSSVICEVTSHKGEAYAA